MGILHRAGATMVSTIIVCVSAPQKTVRAHDNSQLRNYTNMPLVQAFGVFVLCCGAATFVFWPRLQHGLIGAYDCAITFLPARLMAWKIMTRFHELPLWSPVDMLGAPFFADGNTSAMSPFNVLFGLFANPILAFNIIAILHVGCSGLGTFLFIRAWRVHFVPALFGAVAFALCGFMTHNKEPIGLLFSVVWMPWLICGVEYIAQQRWLRGATLMAVALALQFYDGIPQTAFYSHCFVAAYVLFRLCTLTTPRWLFAAVTVMAWSAGLCFSMPFLLCAKELIAQSTRATSTYDYTLFGSLHYGHLLGLVFPFLCGSPFTPGPYPGGDAAGTVVYGIIAWIGVSTLCVLPLALCIPDGLRRRLTVFLLFCAISVLFLALTDTFNLHFNFFLYLPVYGLFRDLGRTMFIWSFAAAVIAALALDTLITQCWSRCSTLLIRAALVAALCSVVWLMVLLMKPEQTRFASAWFSLMHLPATVSIDTFCNFINLRRLEIVLPLLAALASLSCLLAATWRYARHVTVPLLLAMLVLEQRWTLPYYAPLSLPYATAEKLCAAEREYAAYGMIGRVATPDGVAESFGAMNISLPLLQKYAMIPTLAQYTSFPLVDWATMFDMGLDGKLNMPKVYQNLFFLSQANITHLLRYPPDGAHLKPTTFLGVDAAINGEAKPRAFLASAFITVQNTNAMFNWLARVAAGTTTPIVLMPEYQNFSRVCASAVEEQASTTDACKILHATANSLRLAAQCPARRLLVIADTYYPGWTAEVDGVPVTIYRVNGVMRGVLLETGAHIVTLRYRPAGFRLGVYCALAGFVLLILGGRSAGCCARRCAHAWRWPRHVMRGCALILMLLWLGVTLVRDPLQWVRDTVRGTSVVAEQLFSPPHMLNPISNVVCSTLLIPNVPLTSNATYQFDVVLSGTPGTTEYVLADLIAVRDQWNPSTSRIVVPSDQITPKLVTYTTIVSYVAPPPVTDLRVVNLGNGCVALHAVRLSKTSSLTRARGMLWQPGNASYWFTIVYLCLNALAFSYCPWPGATHRLHFCVPSRPSGEPST